MSNDSMWSRATGIISTVIAVAGFLFGVHQFKSTQEAGRHRDAAAQQQEFRKQMWMTQLEIYKQGVTLAAAVATQDDLAAAKEKRTAFWQAYWGVMSLVEHPEVESAMVAFGRDLSNWETTGKKPPAIERRAFEVAHCARKSLEKTWSPVDLGDLKEGRCPY